MAESSRFALQSEAVVLPTEVVAATVVVDNGRIEQIVGPSAQRAAQPGANGHGKPCFGAHDQGPRQMAVEQLAQGPFASSIAQFQGQGQLPGQGGNPMIQERRTGFQAGGHRGTVDFYKNVVREVGHGISQHQLLRR